MLKERFNISFVLLLFQDNLSLFKAEPSSAQWRSYVEYVDEMLIDGFFDAVESSLKFFMENTGVLTNCFLSLSKSNHRGLPRRSCHCRSIIPHWDRNTWFPHTDESAGLDPLFEAQLCLQAPEIVFRPSLEFQASDGFPHLVESLISDVFRISTLVPRLSEHIGFPHYQVLMPNRSLHLGLAVKKLLHCLL